jgi:hypothetical protein
MVKLPEGITHDVLSPVFWPSVLPKSRKGSKLAPIVVPDQTEKLPLCGRCPVVDGLVFGCSV